MNDWLDRRPKISRPRPARRLVFETLESRLLLSADVAPLALAVQDAFPPLAAEHRSLDSGEAVPAIDLSVIASYVHEVVFVDASLPDRGRLVADVLAASGGAREAEVILLDPARDGIAQISEALATRGGLVAVHLVTHGGEGRLDLGASTLDAAGLVAHADALAGWASAFAAEGDLLIYGCNVAASDSGQAFLGELARLTGADVAASDDLTGRGGDWQLEFATGAIEPGIAFASAIDTSWTHTLATVIADWDGQVSGTVTETALGSNTHVSTFTVGGGTVTVTVADPQDKLGAGPVVSSALTGGFATDQSLELNSSGYAPPILPSPGESSTITVSFAGFTGTISNVRFMLFDVDTGDNGTGFVDQLVLTTNGGAFSPTSVSVGPGASVAAGFGVATVEGGNNYSYNSFDGVNRVTGRYSLDNPIVGDPNEEDNAPNDRSNGNVYVVFGQSGITSFSFSYQNPRAASGQGIGLHDIHFDVNEPPAIGGLGAIGYTEDGAASVIAPAATVTDPDSANFDTGVLTVSYAANGTAADQLAIRNEGTGAGQIGVSGANVTFGGVTIGTFAGGTGGTNLVVTFNAGATPAAVQALARNVTFANTSNDPSTLSRTVRFTVGDGGGGSAFADATVSVTGVNDAPVNNLPAAITVTEDVATALTGISVADADSAGAPVAVTLAAPGGTFAALTAGGVAIAGSGTGALTLTGTTIAINAFIAGAGVTYTTALDATAAVTLTVTVDDQGNTGIGGALIDTDTTTLNVIAVNDAPTVIAPGAITVTEDLASPLVGIAVNDADGAGTVVSLALTAGSGTLSAASGAGVAVAGSGTGSLALVGTVTAINAFIAGGGVAFLTPPDDTAAVPLIAVVNDLGNNGVGGALASTPANVMLDVAPVNDAPMLGPVTLSIDPLQTVTLNGGNMRAIDVDDPAGSLVFLVTGSTNGRFELAAAPGSAIASFTQAQVAAGEVRFVHTDADFGPSFSIFVSDGRAVAGPGVAVVSFRAPGAETPSLPRAEAQSGSVSALTSVLESGVARIAEPAAVDFLRAATGSGEAAAVKFAEAPEVEVTSVALAPGRGGTDTPLGARDRPLLAFAEMDSIPTAVPVLDFRITPLRHEEAAPALDIALDSVRVSGMALSVGIIWWAARAGGLLASLMASAPAWRHVDPLPVLGRDDEPEIDWSDPGKQPQPDDERAASEMFAAPDGAGEKAVS